MRNLIFSFFLLTIVLIGCKKSTSSTDWTTVNNGLITVSGAYHPSALAVQGSNIYAVTVSGIFVSTNNGSAWTHLNNGLGSDSTSISAIAVNGNVVYAGTNNGNNVVYELTNNSTNWTTIDNGLLPLYDEVTSFAFLGSNVYAVVYQGGIYETSNNGTSWAGVNSGLGSDSILISKLAVLGNNLFAGGADKLNAVYLSTNSGASWTSASSGLPANGQVYTFAVQGTTNIYASICGTVGYGKGTVGLYLSTNNGTSWTAVNNGFLSSYTNAIPVINTLYVNGNNIYAGTHYSGVYVSNNNGSSWTSLNSGLPDNTAVYSIVSLGNNIFASSEEGVVTYPLQ